jgi:predicted O-methyltransferase YrrM
MKVWFWIRRPHRLAARFRYWVWERRNPDKPWLTPGAVSFLDSHLTADMVGIEFGSGRSTTWYARRLNRLTSVEHHEGWYHHIQKQLVDEGITNVEYRLLPLDDPESAPEEAAYPQLPRYVAAVDEFADDTLDFAVVDGHYRTTCIRAVLPKLKPGGFLLVDDANMWPGNRPPIPTDWKEVSRTTNGIKFTVIWEKPRH